MLRRKRRRRKKKKQSKKQKKTNKARFVLWRQILIVAKEGRGAAKFLSPLEKRHLGLSYKWQLQIPEIRKSFRSTQHFRLGATGGHSGDMLPQITTCASPSENSAFPSEQVRIVHQRNLQARCNWSAARGMKLLKY